MHHRLSSSFVLRHDHHFNMPPYKLQKTLESKSNISPSDLVKTQLTEGLQKKKNTMCGGDLSLRVAVGPYRHSSPLYSVLHSQTLLFFLLFLRTADPTRETEQTSLTLITSPAGRHRSTLQIIQWVNRKQQDCTASPTTPGGISPQYLHCRSPS